jgi:hypothetical protein
MGSTVWVLKEGQDEDDCDHSLILDEEKELKRLCRELGVKRLDDLYDYSVLGTEYDGPEVKPEYLDPSEVKSTLKALIKAIKSGQSNIASADELLEELDDCLSKIIEAENDRCRVRLAIIP